MLAELMREHGGIKPVKGQIAPIDGFDERIEDDGFLPDFISEAENLAAFYQRKCFHLSHLLNQAFDMQGFISVYRPNHPAFNCGRPKSLRIKS